MIFAKWGVGTLMYIPVVSVIFPRRAFEFREKEKGFHFGHFLAIHKRFNFRRHFLILGLLFLVPPSIFVQCSCCCRCCECSVSYKYMHVQCVRRPSFLRSSEPSAIFGIHGRTFTTNMREKGNEQWRTYLLYLIARADASSSQVYMSRRLWRHLAEKCEQRRHQKD